MSKKSFIKGLLVGTAATTTALVGAVATFRKTVVEPQEKEYDRIEENRRRANRKSFQAHQG